MTWPMGFCFVLFLLCFESRARERECEGEAAKLVENWDWKGLMGTVDFDKIEHTLLRRPNGQMRNK